MKKYFIVCVFLLLGAIVFSLSSCIEENSSSQKIKELRFNIKVNNPTITKAVKTGWEDGDKILVYFSQDLYVEDYITFTYNADSKSWIGASSEDLAGNEDWLGSDGTMFAICFPFSDVLVDPYYYDFPFIYNSPNEALHGRPVFSYSLTNGDGDDYHIEIEGDIATLTGTLNMCIPDNYVQFYIEESNGLYNQNDKYRLSVEGVKPVSIMFDFEDTEEFRNIELGSGQPMWGYKYGNGIIFSGMIDDTWSDPENDHLMVFFSDGDPAVAKTFSGKTLSSHDAIKLNAPIAANGWSNYMTTPTFTEISGIKWADWYLGGESTLDTDHKNMLFRWGDIIPNGSDAYCLTKYVDKSLTDEFIIFDPARAILGSGWRMPSNSEYSSLLSKCNISITEEEGKIIAKFDEKDGENHTIFLTNNALFDTGGELYLWTNESSNYNAAKAWSLNSGSPIFAEETFAPVLDKAYSYIIRPVYIGE